MWLICNEKTTAHILGQLIQEINILILQIRRRYKQKFELKISQTKVLISCQDKDLWQVKLGQSINLSITELYKI